MRFKVSVSCSRYPCTSTYSTSTYCAWSMRIQTFQQIGKINYTVVFEKKERTFYTYSTSTVRFVSNCTPESILFCFWTILQGNNMPLCSKQTLNY